MSYWSKNTHYLFEVSGYNVEPVDSLVFFKYRDDIYREFPTSKMFIAEKIMNDFSNIESRNYYIIEQPMGKPCAYKGSDLSSNQELLADVFSKKIYEASEYDYKKSIEKEMQLLDEAAQIPVSDINLIREIGNYYEHVGNLSKAADYFSFALDHNSDNPEIRGMLAYALVLNGDSGEAREQAEKAIEKDPKEQNALSALALLEADEYNWKEAKTYAKKAIDYGADDSNVYYAYCEALYKQGEIKAAQNYYNKAFELYRFNPRREKYSEYAGCPFEVLAFHYRSSKGGKELIPCDKKLIRSKCYYIDFKIDVNILRQEEAEIGVKIFTKGILEVGYGSKDGYTYCMNVGNKQTGPDTIYLNGWGTDNIGYWSVGSHEIEIWYKGEKIAEDSFYIYN